MCSVSPSGQFDDVSRLNEAAQLIPHRDRDAAALVCHFAGSNLVAVLGFGHSP